MARCDSGTIRNTNLTFASPRRPANILRLRDLIAAGAEDWQPFHDAGAPGGDAEPPIATTRPQSPGSVPAAADA